MRTRYLAWAAVPVIAAAAWVGWRLWTTERAPSPTTVSAPPAPVQAPQASPVTEVSTAPAPQPAPQLAPTPAVASGLGGQLLRDFHEAKFGLHTVRIDDFVVTSSQTEGVTVSALVRLGAYPDWMAAEDLHKPELRDWLERTVQSALGLVGDSLRYLVWVVDDSTTAPLPDFDPSEKYHAGDGTTWVHRTLAVWRAKPVAELEIYGRKTGAEKLAPPVYDFDNTPSANLSSVLGQLRQRFNHADIAGSQITVRDYQPVVFPGNTSTPGGLVGIMSVEDGARWQQIKQLHPGVLKAWIQQAWSVTSPLDRTDQVLAFAVIDVADKPPPGYDESELNYLPDRRILVVRTLDWVSYWGEARSRASDPRAPDRYGPWDIYTPAVRMDPATTYLVPDRSRVR